MFKFLNWLKLLKGKTPKAADREKIKKRVTRAETKESLKLDQSLKLFEIPIRRLADWNSETSRDFIFSFTASRIIDFSSALSSREESAISWLSAKSLNFKISKSLNFVCPP